MVRVTDILNNGKKIKCQVQTNESGLEEELLFTNSVLVPYTGVN